MFFWSTLTPTSRRQTSIFTKALPPNKWDNALILLGIHRSFPPDLKPLTIKREKAELKAAANGAAKVEAAATSAAGVPAVPAKL